ncbi:Cof-type HAD-IIB family hydrolase [Atopobiaceae bacterium SGI.236]
MYRLVASDMDETFLDHDHAIPRANVEAIRRLRELGIPFVPSSGRPYDSVMSSLEPIRELLEGSYVISFNGGTINRVGDPNPIASSPMDFDRMRAIFEYGLDLGDVGFHVYEQTGRMWVWNLSAGEFGYISRLIDFDDLPSASIDFLRDTPVAKIIFNHPDMARLRQIVRDMPAELLDGVDTTFSSGRFLEFMPAGVTKGTGVTRLAELLGIPMSDVICCGDAANDESMVRAAGLGVAVAGAGDGLPQIADYIASSTCDDGVIAEVVEKFVEPSLRLG